MQASVKTYKSSITSVDSSYGRTDSGRTGRQTYVTCKYIQKKTDVSRELSKPTNFSMWWCNKYIHLKIITL